MKIWWEKFKKKKEEIDKKMKGHYRFRRRSVCM
jgi:hypothetical protein